MAACLLTALAIAAAQAGREGLEGEFTIRRSAMARESAARMNAIHQAVAALEPAQARRWAGMLEAMTTPQGKLRITMIPGEISLSEGERPVLLTSATGAERTLNDYTRATQRIDGDSLIKRVTLDSLEGRPLRAPLTMTSRHTLHRDRRTLTVQMRIEGGALTRAIDLSTTYDRL